MPRTYPPYQHPLLDRRTGAVTKPWHLFFLSLVGSADVAGAITPGSVTFDKLEDLASPRLLGRGSAGVGPVEAITIGDGLAMTGTELAADATAIAAHGYWTPITNGDPLSPEIIFDAEGDCVVGFVPTDGTSGGGSGSGGGGLPAHATTHEVGGADEITGALELAAVGVGGAVTASAVATFAGQYYAPLVSLGSSGAARTIDWSAGNDQALDLTASCTLTFTNPVNGGRSVLLVTQTGAFTITWPAAVRWAGGTAPVVTSTAGKIDLFTFIYVSSGAYYLGAYNQNY